MIFQGELLSSWKSNWFAQCNTKLITFRSSQRWICILIVFNGSLGLQIRSKTGHEFICTPIMLPPHNTPTVLTTSHSTITHINPIIIPLWISTSALVSLIFLYPISFRLNSFHLSILASASLGTTDISAILQMVNSWSKVVCQQVKHAFPKKQLVHGIGRKKSSQFLMEK